MLKIYLQYHCPIYILFSNAYLYLLKNYCQFKKTNILAIVIVSNTISKLHNKTHFFLFYYFI